MEPPYVGCHSFERSSDDTELPVDTEAVMAVPVELILPFLPSIKRARLCPVSIHEN